MGSCDNWITYANYSPPTLFFPGDLDNRDEANSSSVEPLYYREVKLRDSVLTAFCYTRSFCNLCKDFCLSWMQAVVVIV